MQKEVEAQFNATIEKGQETFIIAADKKDRMNEMSTRDPEAGLRDADAITIRPYSAIVKGTRRSGKVTNDFPAVNVLVTRNGKSLVIPVSSNTLLAGRVYPVNTKLVERDGKKFVALNSGVNRFGQHLHGVTIVDDTDEKGQPCQHFDNDKAITFTLKGENCYNTVFGTYDEKYRDNEVSGETEIACAL